MKILDIKENQDGSATIYFELTKGEKDLLKRVYNKKRFHVDLVRRMLIDAVNSHIQKKEIIDEN